MHNRHLLPLLVGLLLVWFVSAFAMGSDAAAAPITVAWRQPYNASLVAVTPTPTIDVALKQQADQLKEDGNAAAQVGDLWGAQHAYQSALQSYRQLHDRDGEARALYNLGSIYATDWDPTFTDYSKALASFQQALAIWRELVDPLWEARTRYNIGWVYAQMGNSQQAITHFDEALTLLADLHDLLETGNALVIIATGYEALKAYEEAIDAYQQALPLFQRAGEDAKEGIILQALGQAVHGKGDDRQAIIYLTEARQRFQQNGDRLNAAVTAKFMGLIYVGLGDYLNALNAYQDAVELLQQSEEWVEVAITQSLLGDVFNSLGEYYQALVQYDAALTFWQQTDVPEREDETAQAAELLGVKGQLYLQLGDYAQAEAAHTEARLIWQQLGEPAREATALRELGFLAALLEQYPGAFRYYGQALALWKTIDDRAGQAQILTDMGIAADWQGDPRDAIAYLEQALPLRQAEENTFEVVRILNKLSFTYGQLWLMNDLQAGELSALRAHRIAAVGYIATLTDPAYKTIALSGLGLVHTLLGETEAAEQSYSEALSLAEAQHDAALQVAVLESIGLNAEFVGNVAKAIAHYRSAIALSETMREHIRVEELKAAFAAEPRQVDLYQRLIQLLWQTGDSEEAFHYAERARARAFLDQLGGQTIAAYDRHSVPLVEEEQTLRQTLGTLERSLQSERAKPFDQQDQQKIEQWNSELDTTQQRYISLLTTLKIRNPAYAALISIDPVTLRELQRKHIDPQTTLISYFVLNDRTFAWVIDRTTITAVELPASRAEIQQWRGLLDKTLQVEEAALDIDYLQQILGTIYERLFAPLQPHLRHQNLTVIPHDELHFLPYAALWNAAEETYLIETYQLTYAPSASALAHLPQPENNSDGEALILGNPDSSLPNAKAEALAVAELFGAEALIGSDATESALVNAAVPFHILHLAAHGTYNATSPFFSRIELTADDGNDGYLEVHEVFNLDFPAAPLVVLSACESAVGTLSRGDDLIGLTRAFFYAGAPSVVTTLWNIDDEATVMLMESFYRRVRKGLSIAEALQAAQQEILATEAWQSPYYWAVFTLHGDGQQALQLVDGQ